MGEGCYICRPEDPEAPEDGCPDCERDFVENYAKPLAEEESRD